MSAFLSALYLSLPQGPVALPLVRVATRVARAHDHHLHHYHHDHYHHHHYHHHLSVLQVVSLPARQRGDLTVLNDLRPGVNILQVIK